MQFYKLHFYFTICCKYRHVKIVCKKMKYLANVPYYYQYNNYFYYWPSKIIRCPRIVIKFKIMFLFLKRSVVLKRKVAKIYRKLTAEQRAKHLEKGLHMWLWCSARRTEAWESYIGFKLQLCPFKSCFSCLLTKQNIIL